MTDCPEIARRDGRDDLIKLKLVLNAALFHRYNHSSSYIDIPRI